MDALALLGADRCAGCGRRVAALCSACRPSLVAPERGPRVPYVARLLAPWAYDGAARALVLELKLAARRDAATPLVEAMVAEARRAGLGAEVVTWVPGRRRESRRRGFNHAELLARGVAAKLGLPAMALLRATGPRPDQTALSARARRANLRGAFVAGPCRHPIVLVDDLVTTGATAASCAAALRRAGAPTVDVLAACRAARPVVEGRDGGGKRVGAQVSWQWSEEPPEVFAIDYGDRTGSPTARTRCRRCSRSTTETAPDRQRLGPAAGDACGGRGRAHPSTHSNRSTRAVARSKRRCGCLARDD